MKTPNGQDMPRFVPRDAPQTWAIKIASVDEKLRGSGKGAPTVIGARLTFEGDYYMPVNVDKKLAAKASAGSYFTVGADGSAGIIDGKTFERDWKAAS